MEEEQKPSIPVADAVNPMQEEHNKKEQKPECDGDWWGLSDKSQICIQNNKQKQSSDTGYDAGIEMLFGI